MSLRKTLTVREVPEAKAGPLAPFLLDIKRAIDAIARQGVSLEDLVNSGIGQLGDDGTIEMAVPDDQSTTITPPAPSNVSVTGGFSSIYIQYGGYSYRGHNFAEILRGDTDDYSAAVVIANSQYGMYADQVGVNSPYFYYWVRFVSKAGRRGPPDSQLGTRVQSSRDPGLLLTLLTNQLTSSQLDATLRSRIDLVDGSGAGSVTARILAEANARGTAISNLQTIVNNADGALASSISAVSAVTNTNTAAIQTETTARTNADSALASQITAVVASANTNTAAIVSEATARANADSAIASNVTTLFSSVGTNTAAIATEATTRATQTGVLFAQYTVKVDVNGYVSGFGLASTAYNDAPSSVFAINAGTFYISSPTGPGIPPITPFVVNTVSQLINGVVVPPGVYMDAAYIKNGTITNAKIGDAAIDTAKIGNAAITRAKIAYAAIGSAEIEAASITAANIADAAITRAKIGFAAIGSAQIEAASIVAANIADATITSAKIGNLEVDTAKIAGEAVTVPSAVRATGTLYGGSYQTVLGLYITIDAACWIFASYTGNQGFTSGVRDNFTILEMDGEQVSVGGTAITTGVATSYAIYRGPGTYYIRVIWYGQDSTVTLDQRVLYAIGAKK